MEIEAWREYLEELEEEKIRKEKELKKLILKACHERFLYEISDSYDIAKGRYGKVVRGKVPKSSLKAKIYRALRKLKENKEEKLTTTPGLDNLVEYVKWLYNDLKEIPYSIYGVRDEEEKREWERKVYDWNLLTKEEYEEKERKEKERLKKKKRREREKLRKKKRKERREKRLKERRKKRKGIIENLKGIWEIEEKRIQRKKARERRKRLKKLKPAIWLGQSLELLKKEKKIFEKYKEKFMERRGEHRWPLKVKRHLKGKNYIEKRAIRRAEEVVKEETEPLTKEELREYRKVGIRSTIMRKVGERTGLVRPIWFKQVKKWVSLVFSEEIIREALEELEERGKLIRRETFRLGKNKPYWKRRFQNEEYDKWGPIRKIIRPGNLPQRGIGGFFKIFKEAPSLILLIIVLIALFYI